MRRRRFMRSNRGWRKSIEQAFFPGYLAKLPGTQALSHASTDNEAVDMGCSAGVAKPDTPHREGGLAPSFLSRSRRTAQMFRRNGKCPAIPPASPYAPAPPAPKPRRGVGRLRAGG